MSSDNGYYFKHDKNFNEKAGIELLRIKFGIAGYGLYFILLEKLLEYENRIEFNDCIDILTFKDPHNSVQKKEFLQLLLKSKLLRKTKTFLLSNK